MQLVFQLSFSRLLFNELPSNLQFLSWTTFKTLRVMEDKVTSRICNMMLNMMQASLWSSLHVNGCIHTSLSGSPQLMASNESQTVQADYLQETQQSNEAQTHWTDLPSLSYMMGFTPFATPQTFSRTVVLPALALPMTRMRKCGHR